MKTLNELVLAVLLAAFASGVGCASRSKACESANAARVIKGNEFNKNDAGLRHAVDQFIEAADRSDTATVASMYAHDFVNVRITDEGDVVRLERGQLLAIFGRVGGHHIPTKSTTVQHVEVDGNAGFVLLTRIKDLGNGWQPMFYSLVWKRQGEKWLLSREFVHQRSLPNSRKEMKP
jgi:ketosteroid isomerase-like protein